MIKIFSAAAALILFQCTTHAQIPYSLYPSGITGINLADTILNTKEVLVKAGVKSYSYQIIPAPEKTFNTETVYINRQGNIIAYQICMPKTSNSAGFCLKDTFLYDGTQRLSASISFDGAGRETYKKIADHSNEREIKYMGVSLLPYPDTSFEFQDYNENGQLTGMMYIRNIDNRKDIVYTKLFYNKNGDLDSAHDGFSSYGTTIFKRKVKEDKTIIEAANNAVHFKWTYNTSGKCIEMEWNFIKQKDSSKFLSKYFYNTDGTLAKVTEKKGKMPESIINYAYVKW